MYLSKISLINFKNYDELMLNFSAKVNCIVGDNGVGKTNIMDAIYYLSFCKSYFNPIDSHNIKHDTEFFSIQGEYQRNEKMEKIFCGIKKRQKKKFSRNKKEYSRLADHIGLLPLVMISPTDSELITEGSEVRRKLIDSIIAQFNPQYLDQLLKYNKALMHRNALLKQFYNNNHFNLSTLEIWNEQICSYGKHIHDERIKFTERFQPYFQKYYSIIGNSSEKVDLIYQSQLNEDEFANLLSKSLSKDRKLQHTTTGIHKDDLIFNLNNHPIKKFGSQGQQKSYLLALKLGQTEFIKKELEENPILILDDIYDKLDEKRVGKLAEIVSSEEFGQVFISDAHPKRSLKLFENQPVDVKLFEIKDHSNVREQKTGGSTVEVVGR